MDVAKKLAKALECDISELLLENNTAYGSVYRQGALRCTLRTEKRKYKPLTKNDSDIVTALRNQRKLKGYTTKEFADMIGMISETYSAFEYGHNRPDITSLEKIAVALNCKVSDLVVSSQSRYTSGEYKGATRYELRKEPIKFYNENNLIFCTDTGIPRLSKDMRKRFTEMIHRADISGVSIHSLRYSWSREYR